MRNILLLIFIITAIHTGFSQTPQIAVVKPDGTTTIHSILQAAYDAAEDDDHIYLPGGTFTIGFAIHKRLHIFGVGWEEDSCLATGITIINSAGIYIGTNASGGSLTGFKSLGGIDFYGNVNNFKVENLHMIHWIICSGTGSNLVIINNRIDEYSNYSINGNISNSFIANNFILSNCQADSNTFINNIFFKPNVELPPNSTFENNIFKDGCSTSNSILNNNANVTIQGSNNNIYNNNVTEAWPDIFIDPGPAPYDYNEDNDYHVKESSQCKNAGTDGTDMGIYGGPFPWVPGSIPSNPHIMYRNISRTTNPNALLPINVTVKAQNN